MAGALDARRAGEGGGSFSYKKGGPGKLQRSCVQPVFFQAAGCPHRRWLTRKLLRDGMPTYMT